MRIVDREQIRAYDRHAIEQCAVPGLVLMENAGRGAADHLVALLGGASDVGHQAPESDRPVLIVCGPGNNGGDGFVVGRHLLARKLPVEVVLIGAADRVRGDARVNLDAFEGVGGRLWCAAASDERALREAAAKACLLVDALFGTGLDRPIVGWMADVVGIINESRVPVVALDIPSGIDANRGQVLGVAVRAAETITFAWPKLGMFAGAGVEHAGRVARVGLGVPDEAILAAVGHAAETVEAEQVVRALGRRAGDVHKYQAGSLLVVAGRPGKVGAALLAGRAALRAGAGIVAIGTWPAAADALDVQTGELMTARIEPERLAETLEAALVRRDAVAIGPGLGLDEPARELVDRVVLGFEGPVVVDADAISVLAGRAALLRDAPAARVLTPHSAELARLLGTTTAEIESDRFGWAAKSAEQTGQIVVLKGRNSIVAAPDRPPWVCCRGSSVLATAGSGDVLTGVLGALLCVAEPHDAACAAVWLHAVAAELWQRGHAADRGLIASDLVAHLPDAIAAAQRNEPVQSRC